MLNVEEYCVYLASASDYKRLDTPKKITMSVFAPNAGKAESDTLKDLKDMYGENDYKVERTELFERRS